MKVLQYKVINSVLALKRLKRFFIKSEMGANTVKRATKDVISALKNGYG
jgi:hypothetical protein